MANYKWRLRVTGLLDTHKWIQLIYIPFQLGLEHVSQLQLILDLIKSNPY
jgi:hypothetical protein